MHAMLISHIIWQAYSERAQHEFGKHGSLGLRYTQKVMPYMILRQASASIVDICCMDINARYSTGNSCIHLFVQKLYCFMDVKT